MAIEVEDLYRRYGPMVLRRCRYLLKNEERAMDAMQDTFVQMLRYAHRLDDRAPSSLLFRMATNVCLNHLRSRKRRPEDAKDPEDSDNALLAQIAEVTSESNQESKSAARTLLANLFGHEPPSTGAMAVMFWLDGMTHEEVAREVGMSVSGVRKRLRGLQNLVNPAEVRR